MQRLLMPHRLGDAEVFRGTWSDFVPAVPLSAAGAVAAAAGFVGGWAVIGLVGGLLLWPVRRRRQAPAPGPARPSAPVTAPVRPEPPLRGPARREPPLTRADAAPR